MGQVHCNCLAGGRIKLKRIVRDAMSRKDKRNLVLGIAPGVGKTKTTLQQAGKYGHHRKILYSAPNHDLAKEGYQRFLGIPDRPDTYYMWGRNKSNCVEYEQVKEATRLGYFPATVVCTFCDHASYCEYNSAFAALESAANCVVFCTTQQAIKVLDVMGGRNSLWIVDEPGLQQFLDQRVATADDFTPYFSLMGTKCRELIQELRTKMENIIAEAGANGIHDPHIRCHLYSQHNSESGISLFEGLGIDNKAVREIFNDAILRINLHFGRTNKNVDNDSPGKRFKAGLHENAYRWLSVAAGWSDTLAAYVESNKGRITFNCTSIPIREKMNKTLQVLALDGTHYPETIARTFSRDFAEITLHTETVWKRRVFAPGKYGKAKAITDNDKGLMQGKTLLQKVAAEIEQAGKLILLVTYMAVEENVLAYCQQTWPGKEWASEHFGNIRGKNSWEHFDAVLLLGCPTPHPQQSKDDSDLIFPDEPDKNDGYRKSLPTAEIIQAVHRIRPVNNPGKRSVIICGRQWPQELGKPDVWLRQKPALRSPVLKNAFDRASMWIDALQSQGAVRFDQEVAWMLGIGLPGREKAISAGRQHAPELLAKIDQGLCRTTSECSLEEQESTRMTFGELTQKDLNPILLNSSKQWQRLLQALGEYHELPFYRVRLRGVDGRKKYTAGTGSNESVIRFHDIVGIEFCKEEWTFAA